jgi:hypothetical protein
MKIFDVLLLTNNRMCIAPRPRMNFGIFFCEYFDVAHINVI